MEPLVKHVAKDLMTPMSKPPRGWPRILRELCCMAVQKTILQHSYHILHTIRRRPLQDQESDDKQQTNCSSADLNQSDMQSPSTPASNLKTEQNSQNRARKKNTRSALLKTPPFLNYPRLAGLSNLTSENVR